MCLRSRAGHEIMVQNAFSKVKREWSSGEASCSLHLALVCAGFFMEAFVIDHFPASDIYPFRLSPTLLAVRSKSAVLHLSCLSFLAKKRRNVETTGPMG